MTGTLYIVGMGPGDPELVTKKAEKILNSTPVIAYFAKKNETGHARSIAEPYLTLPKTELRFEYPITTEISHHTIAYKKTLETFYDQAACHIQHQLDQSNTVALLCEGDPFLYGSAIYILERLQDTYTIVTIPGISAMSGCWHAAQMPIVRDNQTLTVIPATLSLERLIHHLQDSSAIILMKIGRNFQKVHEALKQADRLDHAVYVEKGTQCQERILPLKNLQGTDSVPYFSLILVKGKQ